MNRRARPCLGTMVDIAIADGIGDENGAVLRDAFDAAFGAIAHVHRCMSFHEAGSDVARINAAAAGTTLEVDPATLDVLRAALAFEADSGGIFDIGIAPRLAAWGMLPAHAAPPPRCPASACLAIGDDGTVRKTAAGWIDLGGIAKGYAVDAAVAALAACGVRETCVNAGGDLRVLGARPFEVGVRDPAAVTAIALTLHVADAALASSGTYFTRSAADGTVRSALLDGRSGEAVGRALGVSVMAPTCMAADALTKIVAATGDARHPLLARHGASALII